MGAQVLVEGIEEILWGVYRELEDWLWERNNFKRCDTETEGYKVRRVYSVTGQSYTDHESAQTQRLSL